MSTTVAEDNRVPGSWTSPIDVSVYDRDKILTSQERAALGPLVTRHWGGKSVAHIIDGVAESGGERLVRPLSETLAVIDGDQDWKNRTLLRLLRLCLVTDSSFWAWDRDTWARHLNPAEVSDVLPRSSDESGTRLYMMAMAYHLGCIDDPSSLEGRIAWPLLAQKVFGHDEFEKVAVDLDTVLAEWGYGKQSRLGVRSVLGHALLTRRTLRLADLTYEFLRVWRQQLAFPASRHAFLLSRVLAHRGVLRQPLDAKSSDAAARRALRTDGVPVPWVNSVERWERTSTLSRTTRSSHRGWLLKIGRWLQQHRPDAADPADWDRQTCADVVAAIEGMRTAEYISYSGSRRNERGDHLSPRSKCAAVKALRVFFSDAYEWEWFPHKFNPSRTFAVPRSIQMLITMNPRTIADDAWAKLMWAGLNLAADDIPRHGGGGDSFYPLALLRAVAVVWLFAGLRSDEIVRLRTGCIRWQQTEPDSPAHEGDGRICLLDVPVHKTGHDFTKPVDAVVGDAIAAWEQERLSQPPTPDRKTGELVHILFAHRARPLSRKYINDSLIPILCRKAGVPRSDVKGTITSHHAFHNRKSALQRQGPHDTVRAAGMAWSSLTYQHAALRPHHSEHAHQGVP